MNEAWQRIELHQGDITKLNCDAIVNAANQSLLGGGGVDGAIHAAAGPGLLAECRSLGGCPTGEAKLTRGYNLPAGHVIHTVGPRYHGGSKGEADQLKACYINSLELAVRHDIKTIAFPSISCGIYGYPIDEAARIAVSTTLAFLSDHPQIERVTFAVFSGRDLQVYEKVRAEWLDQP